MDDKKKQAILTEARDILKGQGLFTAQDVIVVSYDPHPYTIGPRHVAHAADHYSGRLSEASIEDAEKHGIGCAHRGCVLSYERHTTSYGLLLRLTRDLGNKEAAQELTKLKPLAEQYGIEGFAFENLHKEFEII